MNDLSLSNGAAPGRSISEAEYQKFCAYFHKKTGIFFSESKRYFVDKRLIERLDKTRAEDFEQYFNRLRRGDTGDEIEQLINLLTVNETYFYREEHQFECMVKSMLPEAIQRMRPGETIRIWSIPCSTGEEPYSIALYLLEHWPQVDNFNVEIIASDIDTNVLRAAQAGLYDQRSLQRLSRPLVDRYFTRVGQEYRLIEAIRSSVRFGQLNVMDHKATASYAHIDIIFCRNMLIYFDDQSRQSVVQQFYECLTPGGFICLGHSESMSRISAMFKLRAFPQAVVYQKPLKARVP